MTLAQLQHEIRLAYESRDRERMEWALDQLETLLRKSQAPTAQLEDRRNELSI